MKRIINLFTALALIGALGFPGATAHAQTETVLYTFTVGGGAHPRDGDGVIMDTHGNLFGTTDTGGAYDFGVVYMLAPPYGQNSESVLHSFTGGADGRDPLGGVIVDPQGNLYGTTTDGGAYGYGVVFELTPPSSGGAPWTETVLYNFTGGADGAYPQSSLIMDAQGNLFGSSGGYSNFGTVFKLAPPYGPGNFTVLYTFTGYPSDGAYPSRLIEDSQGNLYGTTAGGGNYEYGLVFKLSLPPGGGTPWIEQRLYEFGGGGDGAYPASGVVMDSQGNLYGSTPIGGANNGGVVFKLTPSGNYSVLHTFTGGAEGADPSGVILDTANPPNLYGTTVVGGGSGSNGVVFKLDPAGNETVLYNFTGGADGGEPVAGLVQDGQGNLYGTTYYGGAGYGVVFAVSPGNSNPMLASVILKSKSVKGGQSTTGTVTLTAPAPVDGAVVWLGSSNSAIASVPYSVTVPNGQTSAAFTVTTASVSKTTTVTIYATFNGTTKTTTLKVKR